MSYQAQLFADPAYQAVAKINCDYRQCNLIRSYLWVYQEIIGECTVDNLVQVGGKITPHLPINDHLYYTARREYSINEYNKYITIANILDTWGGFERKTLANIIMELVVMQHDFDIGSVYELLTHIKEKRLLITDAHIVLKELAQNVEPVYEIIERLGLEQEDHTDAITKVVILLIAQSPKEVQQYRDGNVKILGSFTGRTIKQLPFKVNPAEVNAIIRQELDKVI